MFSLILSLQTQSHSYYRQLYRQIDRLINRQIGRQKVRQVDIVREGDYKGDRQLYRFQVDKYVVDSYMDVYRLISLNEWVDYWGMDRQVS